ncbi:hypothetical protein NBRC116601_07310 [Cognatishimia sp. WU-CL00825]|uniref:hypothetical protein n=1 Tax=Cognatishimia sp. WU-CL00825 TaxID=3127658 RepID=UPI003102772B
MTEQTPKTVTKPVHRRRVFYIPGYDPIHPRRYRELYRKESAAQAAISDYEVTLQPKKTSGTYGWRVTANIENIETTTDIEVLVWADIVRDSMDVGILATYAQLLRTAWCYIGSGALWRLMKLRKGPVIAALYPVVFLLVQLLLSLLAAYGLAKLITLFLPWWAGFAALAIVPGLLNWFKKKDNKFFAYYLMHDYAYAASTKGANPPELERRMAEFTAQITAALKQDFDEVLVVGHSSGAHLAVSVLADLLRQDGATSNGPKLSFLSLGQVVPMVSFLPKAARLRADLRFMAAQTMVPWIDVTAPGDGCAFALCDPVSVSGVAPEQGKTGPLVLSAAFTQTLSPARWKELRWKFFRLHFQYLCAFDQPGDYDYFKITAGGQTLGQRFEGRAASGSRIETPVNKFTATAL